MVVSFSMSGCEVCCLEKCRNFDELIVEVRVGRGA